MENNFEYTFRNLGCRGEDDAAISVFGMLSSVILGVQLIMNIIISSNNNNNNNNNDNNNNNNNNLNDNSMIMTMVTNTNMNSKRKRKRSLRTIRKTDEDFIKTTETDIKTLKTCAYHLICDMKETKKNRQKHYHTKFK